MRLHHTGVISQSIENDLSLYMALGYLQFGEIVVDSVQNNRLAFLKNNDESMIELIEPFSENSSIKKATLGFHHICYETEDLDIEIENIRRLRLGTVFTDILLAPAFNNRRIVFIYLRTKLIIELLER